jgi:hypothetical protein
MPRLLSSIIHQDLADNDRRVRDNAQKAAALAQTALREALGVQGPPASRPGQIPHRRSGELQRSAYARVARSGPEGATVEIGATAPHAARVAVTRPFIEPTMARIRPAFEAELFRDL